MDVTTLAMNISGVTINNTCVVQKVTYAFPDTNYFFLAFNLIFLFIVLYGFTKSKGLRSMRDTIAKQDGEVLQGTQNNND